MVRREHRDPYVVLGVGRQASAAEIARAFRRAARDTHPDTSAGRSESAERFRAVSDAYETLRDPRRRAAYDRAHPTVRPTPRPPAARRGSAVYASPGSRHIVLGGPPPVVRAGRVEVVPPRQASKPTRADPTEADLFARLIFTLLRPDW